MFLIWENPLLGLLEGLGHENLDIHDPTLPMALVMDLPASKPLSKIHK